MSRRARDFANRPSAIERDFLDRARLIDAARLSPGARITWDIFVGEREIAIEGQKFHEELPAAQPDERPADGSRGLRLRHRPAAIQAPRRTTTASSSACANSRAGRMAPSRMMRTGMARGITLPRPVVAKMVPQLREIVTPTAEDSIYWAPIAAMPTGLSRRRSASGITRRVRGGTHAGSAAGLHAARGFPRARLSTRGAHHRRLERPARRADLVSLAHPRLDHHGPAAGARSTSSACRRSRASAARCSRVKEQVGFQGDLDAFFRYLEHDPRFYFTNEQELLDAYRDVKRRIDALLPKLFSDFPKADYEIRPVEPFRAASAAGASYQAPSADGTRPGIFYINTLQPAGAAALWPRNAVAARGGAGTSLPDRDPAGTHRPAALPALQRLRVVRRRLGAVRRIDRQGAGLVHRSVPVVRAAVGRNAARHAAGGGHRACIRRDGRASSPSSTCSTIHRWPRAM